MSFFEKLKKGLAKTKNALFKPFADLFKSLRRIDEDLMEELEENAIQDCIECGCCLYSCPANIPLLDVIRIAKGDVIRIIRGRAAAAKK